MTIPIGLLLSLFTIVCLTKLADASHNGTEPTAEFAGVFSRSARAGCVRAGRGECVRLRAILDKRLVLMAMASVSFFEVFNHTICPERVSTE